MSHSIVAIFAFVALMISVACSEPAEQVYPDHIIERDVGRLVGLRRMLEVQRTLTVARNVCGEATRIMLRHVPDSKSEDMVVDRGLGITYIHRDAITRVPRVLVGPYRELLDLAVGVIRQNLSE